MARNMWRSKVKVLCAAYNALCTHTLAQTLSLTGRHPPKDLQNDTWAVNAQCEVCLQTAFNE